MRISCLMPTYNRPPTNMFLLEEAVECFLRQDYHDKELLICNDAPGQTLVCDQPGVVVLNVEKRFETLSAKLRYMIEAASGQWLCRWDDDDIHLPHRLSYSARCLAQATEKLEWRPTNYWYYPRGGRLQHVDQPGNTHVMALWHRRLLDHLEWGKGNYPITMSGCEDQAFNSSADKTKLTTPVTIPPEDIYYLYRWGVSDHHLSGRGGGAAGMQRFYDEIGERKVVPGDFEIAPGWKNDYVALAREAAVSLAASETD